MPSRDPLAGFAGDEQDPFLFFRRLDGHITWWSLARCRAALVTPSPSGAGLAAAPLELLAALAASLETSTPAARALLAGLGSRAGRDVWISWAPLEGEERTLLAAALVGGWALFRDAGDALHPETFAWARPTLASGDGAELATLADGLQSLAPRWRRDRWLRGRLGRLRAWIVTGEAPTTEVASRLRTLAPDARLLLLGTDGALAPWR